MSDGRPESSGSQRWEARARVDYPLHYLVWLREHELLKEMLDTMSGDDSAGSADQNQLEKLDPRGRTPLMLAITLDDIESTRLLINKGANVNVKNDEGWTAMQEAIATGSPEMVQLVMEHRDYQRHSDRATCVSKLLKLLEESPDFYVEMKWEFISWVPLVSRMCPSDTYKIFKQGSKVRIDTTLLGFDQGNWERGHLSYIFLGQSQSATFLEVDHETHRVCVEEIQMIPLDQGIEVMRPSNDTIASRLSAPIVSFDIDTKKISFERNKSGIWGWRQDKSEIVNDYNCKVFNASNVEFVTKSRTEHMNEIEKAKLNNTKNPIQSILCSSEEKFPVKSELKVTMAEYFDEFVDIRGKYLRKPTEQTTKVTKIKANLWLSEDYPLSLKEQIMPIVDLMAITSSHFAKLKDFIEMQLPSGFPVKIEIPLYHISNAQITFGNLFGADKAVEGVQTLDSDGKMFCVVEDSVFVPPRNYVVLGAEQRRQIGMDNDDELLQFAVQQSLLETGAEDDQQVDIWEALQVQRPNTPNDLYFDPADEELQRAIHASLTECAFVPEVSRPEAPDLGDDAATNDPDADLKAVLRLSMEEKRQAELQIRMEEEMLEKILQLSLTEK